MEEFVNELPGTPADYDMRTIHATIWMQGRCGIVWFRRDDDAFVLPVAEITGTVATDAPMPDFRIAFQAGLADGAFLVLANPIIGSVQKHDGTAMCLNAFAFRIQPDLSGPNGLVHDAPLGMRVKKLQ